MVSNRQIMYLREVARICDLNDEFLMEIVEFGLLPNTPPELEEGFFSEEDINLLRRIAHLHAELGVNEPGLEIILRMRSRILQLQQQLEEVQKRRQQISWEEND